MVRERSVRHNFLWTAAGNGVYSACQWGIMSVLAKLGSPQMVGRYALGIAVTLPLLALAQLNLRPVLATDVSGQHAFRDYRDLRLVSIGLALGAICAMALAGNQGSEALTVLLAGLTQAVEFISDIYYGLLQLHERLDRVAVSLASRAVLSLGALAAGLALTGRLNFALLSMLVVRTAVLFVYDSGFAIRGLIPSTARSRANWAGQWQIFRTAFPLGVVLMLGALATNTPRYFIARALGDSALGIFAAIASLTTAGNLLVNALGQAATPRLAKLYGKHDLTGFVRLSWQIAGVGLALCAGLLLGCRLAGHRVLTLFFRPEYAQHADLLLPLALAASLGYMASLLGYVITACRRFSPQMPLQAATVGAIALGCWWLVPRYGLIGAALGMVAGPVVQTVGELFVLRSALRQSRASASALLAWERTA